MRKKWLFDLSTVWKLQSTLISVISHNHIILDLRKNLCKNVILCMIMLWTLKAQKDQFFVLLKLNFYYITIQITKICPFTLSSIVLKQFEDLFLTISHPQVSLTDKT